MASNYRSSIFTKREMGGARSLWHATNHGYDPNKPIIAVVNSFSEFVPGHTHLREVADWVSDAIFEAGALPKEFSTIAIDDGIAMGHDGMLYSLPSREVIADSIEYVCNAHKVDAMICLTNCDKITPGMLIATMRLNIPTIIVSGGPMEAGKAKFSGIQKSLDLVDAIVASADPSSSDEEIDIYEHSACPTCGSCSGMFTANSMNCLSEAMGLSLPGNGSLLATHKLRKQLFINAARLIVQNTKKFYNEGDVSVLPRAIASFEAFENAMTLDIAMGGSTNTILHLLAIAKEAEVDFSLSDIDRLSRSVPNICKVAPSSSYHMEDVHRAGGIMAIMGELEKADLLHKELPTVYGVTIKEAIDHFDIMRTEQYHQLYRAAPCNERNLKPCSQDHLYDSLDMDRSQGCIRSVEHAYSKDGGLAVLFGNLSEQGCVVKTAGVAEHMLTFEGPAYICESQEQACEDILSGKVKAGDAVVIRYEGPKGGPGMQEMLYPTSYLKSMGIDKQCALITDGRFSGGTAGLSIGHVSPEAAEGGIIGLIEHGDIIKIDIPNRMIMVNVPEEELAQRKENATFTPKDRRRHVSKALQIYAKTVSNASKGAARAS